MHTVNVGTRQLCLVYCKETDSCMFNSLLLSFFYLFLEQKICGGEWFSFQIQLFAANFI